jgi:allantoin racemase
MEVPNIKIMILDPVIADFNESFDWTIIFGEKLPYGEYKKRVLKEFASPGTELRFVQLSKGPISIESLFDECYSAMGILEKVREAEKTNFDAVVITCFADPALDAAREAVDVPIVGAGEASMLLACCLGHHFSIITLSKSAVSQTKKRVRSHGLESRLASVRAMDVSVMRLREDLMGSKDEFLSEARKAIEEDGADVIIPGCGVFTYIAKQLQEELGVPVINPQGAAIKLAESLVKLHLTQSKTAYPKPPVKVRTM